MSYDFVGKEIHRATIVVCYRANPTTPILYLDGDEGEATESFLRWGVPKKHLEPINFDPAVIAHIRSKYNVIGTSGDINHIISEKADDSHSVIWLDYMCRYDEQHIEVFKQSLRVAPYVCVTFSTRAIDKGKLFHELFPRIKQMSHMLERPYPYKGRSNYENMVKFTLSRKPEKDSSEKDSSDEDPDSDEVSSCDTSILTDQDDDEDHIDVDSKVLVDYRGTWLTAVVTDKSDDFFFVLFDYDGKVKEMPKCKVILNTETIDTSSMIGKEIGIPICLWNGNISGYEGIKRNRKKLCFKIGSRYYNKDRLNIYGINKDGKIHKQVEKWWISPEQAKCWIVTK
jgi:hypothetical protein